MTSPHEQALAACPFCGGHAVLDPFSGPDGQYYVYCSGHKAGCRCDLGIFDSKIEAIAAWNRRPALPSVEGLVAEWEKAAEGVTKWPWQVYDGCSWRRIGTAQSVGRHDDCAVLAPTKASDGHPDLTCSRGNDREANLAWIARCSPDNVLSALRSLSAKLTDVERERDTLTERLAEMEAGR